MFFCGEAKFSLNKSIGIPSEDSVIYCDENVFITPDIAPLIKGHFLIVTHAHLLSLIDTGDSIKRSLRKAKEFLKQTVFESDELVKLIDDKIKALEEEEAKENNNKIKEPVEETKAIEQS